MPVELAEVRRSQIITTYGPGAIVDLRAGGHGGTAISVVVGGLDEWDLSAGRTGQGLDHPQTISEPRLQKILAVKGFRLPPVVLKDENGKYVNGERLPGVRFPGWLHCPQCHTLKQARKWQEFPGDPARYCPDCSHGKDRPVHVIPVRFITCCERGHIDEFPWNWWVGHVGKCPNSERLVLRAEGAGLAGLVLKCPKCGASRSMDGCLNHDAFEGTLKCHGNRPWLGDSEEGCRSTPRGILRGASNVYFPVLASSLDIPPWADKIQQQLGVLDWNRLAAAPHDEKRRAIIVANDLQEKIGISAESLLQAVNNRLRMLESQTEENLRFDEYQAFLGNTHDEQVEFEVLPETVPAELRQFFRAIVRVSRLREVRAIRGFTRLRPPADWRAVGASNFASLSIERKDWLPGIEVRGEGIFLEFNLPNLVTWETRLAQQEFWADRLKTLNESHRTEHAQRHGPDATPPVEISFRMLLVHAFSHALMRQMALGSGYSTASLRERLYCDFSPRDMAGVLIYTASPDADGTLGGLSRQARPARMLELVVSGIQSMAWCSSDPLCIDGFMSRTEPLNSAACHSCLLSPETSCEAYNRFLDRALLVGTPHLRKDGYFSSLLGAH